MPIQAIVNALSDVHESVRSLYVERDGKFILDIDPPIPNVDKLKSALDEERKGRREAMANLAKFEGIDPKKYEEMSAKFEAIKDKKIFDDEGVEILINTRLAKLKEEQDARAASLAGDRDHWKERATQAEMKRRSDVARRKLMEGAAQVGISKMALADAAEFALRTFTVNDQDELTPMNGDAVIYGKNGVDPLSMSEFFDAQKTTRPYWFDRSTGGGANHSQNGQASPDLSTLSPQARINAARMAGKT